MYKLYYGGVISTGDNRIVDIYLYGYVMHLQLKLSGSRHTESEGESTEEMAAEASEKCEEQGYPPLEVCQLARGEEWRGCCPVISVKVPVCQGQGERDERERGGRRGARGGGAQREEDHTW